MTVLTQPDSHRIEARQHRLGPVLAYAVADAWGWALLARRDGRLRTVARVDETGHPRVDRFAVRGLLRRYVQTGGVTCETSSGAETPAPEPATAREAVTSGAAVFPPAAPG